MTPESRGLTLAVAAAFAIAILSISEHARAVEQGYRLAAARREGEVLTREAIRAERRAAALAVPTTVLQRATAMKLGLEHPRDRRILSAGEAALLVAPASSAPSVPNVQPARTPRPASGEVMPK